MACFSPSFYNDEILYSGVARQLSHLGYPSQSAGIREMFGSRCCRANIDLPGHLDYFIGHFPNLSLSADEIIDNHSLFPYYATFLSIEKRNRLRDSMHGDEHSPSKLFLGHHILKTSSPSELRYCPECIQEDQRHFGEPYWHRSHQIPKVNVCPSHKIPLAINKEPILADHAYLSAEYAIKNEVWKPIGINEHDYKLNIDLAIDSDWLLKNKISIASPQAIRDKYFTLLANHGYAQKYGQKIKAEYFSKSFINYYSDSYLSFLDCDLKNNSSVNWLKRLLYSCDTGIQHPIHHLLLIRFLGETSETFFSNKNEDFPFGEGPWMCLNPIADHYQEKIVKKGKIYLDHKRGFRPIGIFTCVKCGFEYSRSGPDVNPIDKYRTGRVRNRGVVWEYLLRKYWGNDELTLKSLSKKLGVTERTVLHHAAQIGLQFPRPGSSRINPQKYIYKRTKNPLDIEDYRRKWEALILQHPNLNIFSLRALSGGIYERLLKHDKEWVLTRPPRKRYLPHKRSSIIDWNKRDIELSKRVEQAIVILRNRPGRPRRITVTSIFRHLQISRGMYVFVQTGKLPLTAIAINGGVDSRISIGIRKIEYCTRLYLYENRFPSSLQLTLRAGVWSIRDNLKIQEALNRAIKLMR